MANRYWVGGTGTWDNLALLKWATTSGGLGGSAVPTSSDDVFFDANSGANTVTIDAGTAICDSLTMTGFTGTLAFGSNSITCAGSGSNTFLGATTYSVTGTPLINITGTGTLTITPGTVTEANSISFTINNAASNAIGISGAVRNLTFAGSYTGNLTNGTRTIYGNLTLKSGMTLSAGGSATTFAATSGTQQITSAALTLDFPITINGVGTTVQLVDALIMGGTRRLTLTNGTLDTNSKNLTCGDFAYSNSNIKTLNLGTSVITIQSGSGTTGWLGSNANTTYASVTNSTIIFTTTGTSCFSGGQGTAAGNQFGTITMSGLGGTLHLGPSTGSVTVARCTTLNNTVSPCTITNSCTTGFTVTNFNVSGTAGNLVTFNSNTSGTARTINQASGTVNAYYLNIQDSNASGGAVWYANSSINGTNNTGWNVFNNSFLMVFN
jgi:hypothetical protein